MNFIKKILYGLIKKNRHLPQEIYAKIYYEYYHDEKLNLDYPQKFNEKIQWLKTYYHVPILTQLVDKYEVRKYVSDLIGKQYLTELYGVYRHYKEINFAALPKMFIVKGTHGCNMHLLVFDKEKLNHRDLKRKIRKWKRKNLYYTGGQEWAYKNVEPRIIIEKYLEGEEHGLIDYRFFCFSGEPKFIQVHVLHNGIRCGLHFDMEWNKMEFSSIKSPTYPNLLPRPKGFKEMIEIAKKLSKPFPFVRVDMYNIKGEIKFGELTFYPADGRMKYKPESFDRILGDYLILPKIPECKKEITSIS